MENDVFAPPTQEELEMFGPPPTKTEAFLRGGVQSGTLGYGDEIAGGIGAVGQAVKNLSTQDFVKNYIKNRDANRAANTAAEATHPYAYGAGQVGGALATAAIPGLNIAKGATLAARGAQAAGLGAATALGYSNADLTQGDIGGAVKDTAIGAAAGPVVQAGLEKVAAPLAGKMYELGAEGVNKLVKAGSNPLIRGAAGAAAGGVLGKMTGIRGMDYVGTHLGGMAGRAGQAIEKEAPRLLDQYGAPIAKKAFDVNDAVNRLTQHPGAQRFIAPLKEAASRGQASLAAMDYMLGQTEPDYQAAMDQNK